MRLVIRIFCFVGENRISGFCGWWELPRTSKLERPPRVGERIEIAPGLNLRCKFAKKVYGIDLVHVEAEQVAMRSESAFIGLHYIISDYGGYLTNLSQKAVETFKSNGEELRIDSETQDAQTGQ